MKFVIVHTAEGVPHAAVTACKKKLAENGSSTSVKSVMSPFDLVPAVQSAKMQHGNDAFYLVLGVTVGTSGTESASAAFNLMSVRSYRWRGGLFAHIQFVHFRRLSAARVDIQESL